MRFLNVIKKFRLIGLLLFALGCGQGEPVQDRFAEVQKSEFARMTLGNAIKDAGNNKEEGFLKLYEISLDADNIYTVEYQEGADDELTLLLYTKTGLWVKALSKVNNFKFLFGVLPENLTEEEHDRGVLANLKKINGNARERALIDHMEAEFTQGK